MLEKSKEYFLTCINVTSINIFNNGEDKNVIYHITYIII